MLELIVLSHCSSGAFHASHYYQTLNGRGPRHFFSDAEDWRVRGCPSRTLLKSKTECDRVKWVRSGKQN